MCHSDYNVCIFYYFSEEYVMRGCYPGVELDGCSDQTINGIKVTACFCTTDLCNSATKFSGAILPMMIISAFSIVSLQKMLFWEIKLWYCWVLFQKKTFISNWGEKEREMEIKNELKKINFKSNKLL